MKTWLRSCIFVLFGAFWVGLASGQEPAPKQPTPADQPSTGTADSPEEQQEEASDAQQPAEQEGLGFGSGLGGIGMDAGTREDTRSYEELPEVEPLPSPIGFITIERHPNQVEYEGLLFKFPLETANELNQSFQSRSTAENSPAPSEERSSLQSLRAEFESRLSPSQLRKLTAIRMQTAAQRLRQAQLEMLLHSTLLKLQDKESHTLQEGVSRGLKKEQFEQLQEEGLLSRTNGNWFYSEPINPDPQLLAQVLAVGLNPNSYRAHRPGKLCGGFHADLAIEAWHRDDSGYFDPVRILFCFGCHEAQILDTGAIQMFDLTDEAAERLSALADRLYQHRKNASQQD